MANASQATRRLPILAKYDVLEELGHGGMATVYRAHDTRLGRDVAVKVLHPHLRDSVEVAHRFSVEARAVAKLHHANIVEVFDISSESDGEQYIVVELLRGKTLRKLLHENGTLPPEVAGALALELLSALAHAHAAGVIHRDVKPENVILEHRAAPDPAASGASARESEPESTRERVVVKLTDFGIAKLLDAKGVTSTGQVLGSPSHMAPEQIEGAEVDARADVFGLGVLLYECMVGHLPFEGTNPAQVLSRVLDGVYPPAEREVATVGRAWSAILDGALARDPAARFADTSVMRDAVQRELKRAEFASPRAELASWIDDPPAYVAAHAKKMIPRLCALGGEARQKGDVLTAAADYNRALAYAPDDAQLLRLVSRMQRASARSRFVKRAGRIGVALFAFALFAFAAIHFAHRALNPARTVVNTSVPPISSGTIAPQSSSVPDPVARAIPTPSAPVIRPAPPLVSAHPILPVRRVVAISRVFPIGGVLLSLDDQSLGSADKGDNKSLTIDERAHILRAECVADMCIPHSYEIPAGDKGTNLSIELTIRDATLILTANPTMHYGVREWPNVAVIAGAPASIPMRAGTASVKIEQRETGRTIDVDLVTGQKKHIEMADAPAP